MSVKQTNLIEALLPFIPEEEREEFKQFCIVMSNEISNETRWVDIILNAVIDGLNTGYWPEKSKDE